MCGICGIIRYDTPAPALAPRLRLMQHRLKHRGPDGEGKYFGSHAALAHTRLALLDRDGGAQPMSSPDGLHTIVYNGEVYNAAELRPELEDRWGFRTRSDVEVVLAAYVVWGKECLDRLNGMFAFFVWDEKEVRGFGARDRLGVKPFVYRHADGEFAFASEAKALVAGGARLHLPSFLEYWIVPSLSGVEHPLFDELEYLPAGHWLEISPEGLRVEKWWDYEMRGLREDEDALAPQLHARLKEAVRRSLVADVPVGVYLSGGIDSTLLAALAGSREAFTIRFAEQDRYDYTRSLIVTSDDTRYARSAAQALGLSRSEVEVEREDLTSALGRISAVNDAIPAWEQEFAQHFLALEASKRVKAVLVGDAADETHFGYHFLLDGTPRTLMERFGAERRVTLLRSAWRGGLLDDLERRYVALGESAGYGGDDPDGRILALTYLIVRLWLGRLLHNGDIHAMAWSLEARVPYADRDLIDLARRVSPGVGFRDGIEKSLLRRAAKGLIPEEIRLRKKSALPKDQGVGREYQAAALQRLKEHGDFLRQYFDLEAVERLCHRPLDEIDRAMLFNLIAFSHWAEHYGVE